MPKINLADIAKKLGKSATDISRDTGVNRNTVNALLNDRVDDVKFSTLEKISKTYNISITDMVEGITAPTGEKETNTKTAERNIYKQEGEIMPFTCWPWMHTVGTFHFIDKGQSYGFGQLEAYFKKDYGFLYWDFHSLKNIAAFAYTYYSDKEKYNKLYNKYLVDASDIEDMYVAMQKMSSAEMKNIDISSFFEKIKIAYKGFWEQSLFIDAFDTGVDQELIAEIATKYALNKKDIEVLTTPAHMTFADERKYALFTFIKNTIGTINIDDSEKLTKILEKNKETLDDYRRKFDYYKSNYIHIKHISFEETREEIKKYLSDKQLFKEEYEKLDQYEKNKEAEIAAILKKLRIKENPFWFFADLTYWREHRKKINLMGIHVLDFILTAIEGKTGIPKKYLGYLSFDEVDNVLKGLISHSALEHRYIQGVHLTIDEEKYKIFEGAEAESIKRELESISEEGISESKIITGQVASQGYAKGIARVVLTQQDFDAFNEGEILVTSMTRPEFVPLMKKAAAIVTNEGGITCHAAIVSRELGKPCIIGTKQATQVIKNGDLVEVRANHGTVRILES